MRERFSLSICRQIGKGGRNGKRCFSAGYGKPEGLLDRTTLYNYMIMTDNDIRNEWERHRRDTLPKDELDAAFIKVMAAADRQEEASEKTMRAGRGHKIRRFALNCAAAAAMLVFVPWLTLHIHDRKSQKTEVTAAAPAGIRLCQAATRNGETREIILPDGSRITLNAGSVLIYPESFSDAERTVFLSGEAIFEVTHDSSHPFVVNTSDIDIRVHGTTFNVNAYPESGKTAATLCEGSISATVRSTGKSIAMVPDQRLAYDRASGEASLSHVNSAEDTAWKRGDMCFRSENIHDIARAIERKYGINTYVTSGKYDDMILTAKFVHGETLEQMLGAVCKLVPGMKYRIENNSVYIR